MSASSTQLPAVLVSTRTWPRDAHHLFDFEARRVLTTSAVAPLDQGAGVLRDPENQVEVLAEGAQKEVRPGSDLLLVLQSVVRGGQPACWIRPPSARSNKLWTVVKEMAPDGHALVENDLIRLGRWKFRIRQLVTAEQTETRPAIGRQQVGTCVPACDDEVDSRCCRICLMEGAEAGDPILAPCACKGSIEFIHLKCLRHWAGSRLNTDHPLGSFCYKTVNCELCKTPFPTHVTGLEAGHDVPIVELPNPQPPYLVLEKETDAASSGGNMHILSLADKAITMGRSADSDVRIVDVSVSRCHAKIHYHEGQFLLRDAGSKFGTCVAKRGPVLLEENKRLCVQVGRTVVDLHLTADAAPAQVAGTA